MSLTKVLKLNKIQTEIELLETLTSSIKQKMKNTEDLNSFFNGIECLIHVLYSCIEYEDLSDSNVKFNAEWLSEISEYINHLRIYNRIDEYDNEL